MTDLSDAIACKLNEIRSYYVEANNRAKDRAEAAVKDRRAALGAIPPEISTSVRSYIDYKLKCLRESVVDHIGFGVNKFRETYYPTAQDNLKTRRFSKAVVDTLEQSFDVDQYPSDAEKERLASVCRLSIRQINNWFTNKRNRTKNNRHTPQYQP
jgi:hypothetical protein